MSRRISRQTRPAAYKPFTPNNSGQRSRPTYYRGCWHVVSRRFIPGYRQPHHTGRAFTTGKRGSQPEGLHPSRDVAASGFRPLCNTPHCCLPQESGPCLSPSVAAHPLRPATRHRLGRPSPHQQADRPRAHPPPKHQSESIPTSPCGPTGPPRISRPFKRLSRTRGQVTHVILTRSQIGRAHV